MAAKRYPRSNPATGEDLPELIFDDDATVEKRLEDASAAFLRWRVTAIAERAERLRAAAGGLRAASDELAKLAAVEMGKPVTQGQAEIEKCAWVCEYFAEHAAEFLADEPAESSAPETFVTYQPLGTVFAVMPWNYPFWQVYRAAAPILMAGNGFLLKHAPNVVGCSSALVKIMREAGFPAGVFNETNVDNETAAKILADRRIAGVTLTGSTRAGRAVAAEAGQNLKRSLLELGGSDPYVVLEDANLAHAAKTCATSRMLNNGQSCIAAKRFIVLDEVYDAFVNELQARLEEETFGDPLLQGTRQGPMARADLRDALHDQVSRSVEAGARALLGGYLPDTPGAFYPASLLIHVPPEAPAFAEEMFGPVASVTRAKDEAEALQLANASAYGLGAALFTQDLDRGRRLAREALEAGCCVVNDFVKSDPRVPFGGIRDSGYGRELGCAGIREFANMKTVAVNAPG